MIHISVDELKTVPGKRAGYMFSEDAETLDLVEEGLDFKEPIAIRVEATYSNGKVFLKGSLRTRVVLACSRCLHSFSLPLESGFEEEIQVDDETALDVADLVRESFITGFPLKPLCDISCKGLCAECGASLNEKQCDCADRQVDHRMLVLKKLLEQE